MKGIFVLNVLPYAIFQSSNIYTSYIKCINIDQILQEKRSYIYENFDGNKYININLQIEL